MTIFRLTFLLILLCAYQSLAKVPQIVASISPVHALVSAVTGDLSDPKLLVGKNSSLHDFAMKPSDAVLLAEADLIFIVAYEFEYSLGKILRNTSAKTQVIELADDNNLKLLPARQNNLWGAKLSEGKQAHAHEHETYDRAHSADHHHHSLLDYHAWTNPANAIIWVTRIAQVLIKKDPANSKIYQANADKTIRELRVLDVEIADALLPYQHHAYLVFHDAYQYFEQHYMLKSIGAISINPSHKPSAKAIVDIKQLLIENHARCLFSEPNFTPKLVDYIAKSTNIKTGVLDAEWGDETDNRNGYFSMMHKLKDNLIACLK